MKLLPSFPSSRKATAALLWALRLAQAPFAAVVWQIEAVASRIETVLEVARANGQPPGDGEAGAKHPAPFESRVGLRLSSGPQLRDCIGQAGEPELRVGAVLNEKGDRV